MLENCPEEQNNRTVGGHPDQAVRKVMVCQHQSCLRHCSEATLAAFQAANVPEWQIEESGCMGQCNIGPTVRILPDNTWYAWVKPEDVPTIVQQHLEGGQKVQEKLNPRIHQRFSY